MDMRFVFRTNLLHSSLSLLLPVLVALALLSPVLPANAGEPVIRVTNYQDGETVRHPVPLLRGTLGKQELSTLVVVNQSSKRQARELKGLVHKGQFKILTELVPGENRLLLKAGKHELALTLTYKPQTNPYVVRAIYMTDSSGSTAYQTPWANDPQDYAAKMDTALKLLQTFTAERMHDLGFGRITFNLELDAQGKVKVHTLQGRQPASYYHSLDKNDWWRHVYAWSSEQLPMKHGKNLVIAAYSHFDPASGQVRGHAGLGGGNMALFGSAGLFTWPSNLGEVFSTFMDERPIDGTRVHDDSAGRGTVWAVASTTLGSVLHELGHSFGLPHSREPLDVMTRGFDHFNRAFTFVDPPSQRSKRAVEFQQDQVARFVPVSAAALKASRWFAPDCRSCQDRDGPRVVLDDPSGNVLIEATHGIRYIGIDAHGDAVEHHSFWEREGAPRRFWLSRKDLAQRIHAAEVRLRVIDADGTQTVVGSVRLPWSAPSWAAE